MSNKEVKDLLFNNLNFLKNNIKNTNPKKNDSVNNWLSKQIKNDQKPNIKVYVKSK